MDDDYFVRRAGYVQWGNLNPFISFHRPLRDYVAAAKEVGLPLRDLEEPEISEEGRRELSPAYYRMGQRVPFSYVLKFTKAGNREPGAGECETGDWLAVRLGIPASEKEVLSLCGRLAVLRLHACAEVTHEVDSSDRAKRGMVSGHRNARARRVASGEISRNG